MSVLKDKARRSLAGSAVFSGGTVMIGGIKVINQSANNLTIGGTSDTITIGGSTSFAGNQGFGAGGTAVKISAGGTILFRNDADIYWGAAGILKTSNALQALTAKLGTGGTKIATTGGGTITFGGLGVPANFYFGTSGQLKTDNEFCVIDNVRLGAGGTTTVISAGGTITFREDANLYQSAADTLKTDDNFQSLTVKLGTGGTKIATTGGGTVIFREDTTNLYWKAAGQLGTDGKFYSSSDIQSASNLITRDAGGTAPLGILAVAGAMVVGNLGGTPRIFANVGGTIYQFNGTGI